MPCVLPLKKITVLQFFQNKRKQNISPVENPYANPMPECEIQFIEIKRKTINFIPTNIFRKV